MDNGRGQVPQAGGVNSRAAALAAGTTFYFTGKPCKHGHTSTRYAVTGGCVQCMRDLYAATRPEWKQAVLDRYYENRETKIAYQIGYNCQQRDADPDWTAKKTARTRRWRSRNPEEWRVIVARRAARKRAASEDHPITADDLRALLEKQKGRCALCFRKLGAKYHIDHIEPLAHGGRHAIGNLQITHPRCNHRKHAKDPFVFAQENGRLL